LEALTIVYHEACLARYFTSAAESPDRLIAIQRKLQPHYPSVTPQPATREDLLRVHSPQMIRKVQHEGPDIYRAALHAAGGACCAARLALTGPPAFAVVRPPGHHAGENRFGKFCFFNNIAIAIASLLAAGAIDRAAVIDTDMHCADGTEDIFRSRAEVTVLDLQGRDRESCMEALRHGLIALPEVDLMAVSAGFDLYVRDWGGLLTTEDFLTMGHLIHRAAQKKARGRCFAVLEGGYYVNDLGKNVLAFCRGFSGQDPVPPGTVHSGPPPKQPSKPGAW
jgi:acetoin utilization deacetylase AcuC-like enzyme